MDRSFKNISSLPMLCDSSFCFLFADRRFHCFWSRKYIFVMFSFKYSVVSPWSPLECEMPRSCEWPKKNFKSELLLVSISFLTINSYVLLYSRFPVLGISSVFSWASHQWYVFLGWALVLCFPRWALMTRFPRLNGSEWWYVFLRLALVLH